jgi:hypothetical protein
VGQDIERLPQGEARRSLETRLSREVAVTQNLERFIQRTWTVKIKDQLQDMGSLAAMLDLADQLGRTSSTSNAG